MPRLSKLLEKLEDTVEARWGIWLQRNKKELPLYIPVGLVCWYFYGMLLNSMRLGIDAVFHNTGQDVTAIWMSRCSRRRWRAGSCGRPFGSWKTTSCTSPGSRI